jgi:hypothetical protein
LLPEQPSKVFNVVGLKKEFALGPSLAPIADESRSRSRPLSPLQHENFGSGRAWRPWPKNLNNHHHQLDMSQLTMMVTVSSKKG